MRRERQKLKKKFTINAFFPATSRILKILTRTARDSFHFRGVSLNRFYTAFDHARLHQEKGSTDYRSAFQIDRDRVLYTPAFRQLQSKTQVFLSGEYDFYRTRLTHSLEVAQIGRSITTRLVQESPFFSADYFIDSDLVEAACLSHDLGHPPFGHAGEQALNELLAASGGFEGNAQTLRLLTDRIFTQSQRGMNPTRAFADSVLKYKTLWSEIGGAQSPPHNHFLYDEQVDILDWVLDGNDFPAEYPPGRERDSLRSIECQIMDWADDAAYSLNDLVDSVKTGFLSTTLVKRWAARQDLCSVEERAISELLKAIESVRLDAFVGKRIGSYITSVTVAEEHNFLSAQTNRYRYRLVVDPEKRAESALYKRMLYELVFLHPTLKQLEYKGREMLKSLWRTFESSCIEADPPFPLMEEERISEIQRATSFAAKQRLLSDYLSGLTDLSAKRLFRRMYDPDSGSITDLLL